MPQIRLGSKIFHTNVFYAPLAGCSDFPFRQMSKRFSPGLVFCEMVKMDALVRNDKNTFRLLDSTLDMHPIGAQLCGSKLELVGICAQMIEDLGFDVIDLNCGCPVDKVTKDGSGSGLLKKPDLIGELISKMVAHVSIPVTVKIRSGWDEHSIIAPQITQIAEQAGAQAIFIHGRTRAQAYTGKANWDFIKESKQAAQTIKVFGNGDIFEPQDALKMLEYTGCDGVLVARGTMGQPWIAEDIQALQQGLWPKERTFKDYLQGLKEHYALIKRYSSETKAILDMRRIGCWYLKKGEVARHYRSQISRVKSLQEVDALLDSLSLLESMEVAS